MGQGRSVEDSPAAWLADALVRLPDPVFVFRPVAGPDGTVADLVYDFVNDAGLALYGLPRDEVVGRTQLQLFPSAAELGIVDHYVDCLRSGAPRVFEVPWFDENGVEGAFLLAAVPFDGRVLVTAHDVSRRVLAEREVEASRREYQQLAEAATDLLIRSDLDLTIRWASPSVQDVLGWAQDAMVGRTVTDLLHPDDRARLEATRATVTAAGVADYRGRFRTGDGGWRWLEVHAGPVVDAGGAVVGRLSAARDVDTAVRAEQKVRESERRYRMLAENASDVVVATNAQGRYVWVSESSRAVLGWSPEDMLGRTALDFLHPDDKARIAADGAGLEPEGAAGGEARYLCADGAYRWFAWTARPAPEVDDGRPGFVGSLVDLSDRKQAEALLEHAATHDPLTGLANRALLTARVDAALATGIRHRRHVGLLLLDLDHFKNVNDSLGHGVGDQLLVAAAERVTATVRGGDLVARHGGDEIVVLMPDTAGPDDAARLAHRLVQVFREPLRVGDRDLFATVSVGVTGHSPDGPSRSGEDLLREADTAMYAAKRAGRDRVARFGPEMADAARDRLDREAALRHALDSGHLQVWYQPEVDLADGGLRAVEALLRWVPPHGPVRTAGEFLGVAEETGLILAIGDWVLRAAARQAAAWAGAGRPIAVRVNLSPLQLAEPDFLAELDDVLERERLDPGLLCVEITETVALLDSATVRANLDGIRTRGVRIALDDFGTGYSSLTYLMDYPADVVKIDRSFVSRMHTSARDRTLIEMILTLAAKLGVAVVAEGIEQVEQADALRSLGCVGAQGFLYSPAVPAAEVRTVYRPAGPDSSVTPVAAQPGHRA